MSLAINVIVQIITAVEKPAYWTHMELRFLIITIGAIGVVLVLICLRENNTIPAKHKAKRAK